MIYGYRQIVNKSEHLYIIDTICILEMIKNMVNKTEKRMLELVLSNLESYFNDPAIENIDSIVRAFTLIDKIRNGVYMKHGCIVDKYRREDRKRDIERDMKRANFDVGYKEARKSILSKIRELEPELYKNLEKFI